MIWRLSSKNRFAEDGGDGTTEAAGDRDGVLEEGRGGDPVGVLGGVGTVVGDSTADGGLELGGEREHHLLRTLEDARTGA